MLGRGDNNKNGTSGQGASNQSGQGLAQTDDREKMNHARQQTGGQPSEPQKEEQDQDSNRDTSTKKETNN